MRRILRICATGGIAVAALVVLLYGLVRGGWLDALLAGIAIGMSLLPEEFPVVLAIFMAMGAWRIAQVGVLTRRASAIESMGAATVLCTDKTGTLTQNRMVAAGLWMASGETADLGAGMASDRFDELLRYGAMASAPIPVDPMEVAFHEAAVSAACQDVRGWTLIHTNTLRPDLLAMTNIWESPGEETTFVAAAKGAPEAIGRLCRLDKEGQARLEAAATAMAAASMFAGSCQVCTSSRARSRSSPCPRTKQTSVAPLAGMSRWTCRAAQQSSEAAAGLFPRSQLKSAPGRAGSDWPPSKSWREIGRAHVRTPVHNAHP